MAVTQYIGARYVPMFAEPIEWSNTVTYEPLTMVTYQGATYTSRQAVPIGIDISNEQYWVCSGNYNAQVETYRQETQDAIKQLDTAIGTATDAATAAKTSETNAAASATAAATSASHAKTSEGNALVSANASQQAAQNSASAEIKSETAAATATEQASAAATSATAAAASATAAAESETKVSNLTNAVCLPLNIDTSISNVFPAAGAQGNLDVANVSQPNVAKFTNVDLYYIYHPGYMVINNTSSSTVTIDGCLTGFNNFLGQNIYCYLVGPDGSIGDIKTGRIIPCYIDTNGTLKVDVTLATLQSYISTNESYVLILPQGIQAPSMTA